MSQKFDRFVNNEFIPSDEYKEESNESSEECSQFSTGKDNDIVGEWIFLNEIDTLVSERRLLIEKSTALNNELKERFELREETSVIQTAKEMQEQIKNDIRYNTSKIEYQLRQLINYYNKLVVTCKADINEIDKITKFEKPSKILKRRIKDNKCQISYATEKSQLSQAFMEELEVTDGEDIINYFKKYLKSLQAKELKMSQIIKKSFLFAFSALGICMVLLGINKLRQIANIAKFETQDLIVWLPVFCNLSGFLLLLSASISYLSNKGDYDKIIVAKKMMFYGLFVIGVGFISSIII